jgi:ribA/ribD-fused uncharacterized protein
VTPIHKLDGKFRPFSNFWWAEIEMPDEIVYPGNEWAFQAYKTKDMTARRAIASIPTPQEAKKAGRTVELRPDWEKIKVAVMLHCLREKFRGHPELGELLVSTGDAYIAEGNTWGDRYWGVVNGVGENWLGRLLMYVRTELQLDEMRMFI